MSEKATNLRFVKEKEMLDHGASVALAMQQQKGKADRRDFLKNLLLVAAVPAVYSGWYMRQKNPVIVEDYKFIPVTERGEIVRAYELDYLPPEAKRDFIAVNYCWQYVIAREEYTDISMSENWDMVSAMSSESVRREYQKDNYWRNSESPYARYGKTGKVLIKINTHSDLAPPQGYSGPPVGYTMHYWRKVDKGDGSPVMQAQWKSDMRFKRGVSGIPKDQLYNFNGLGIQVTSYTATPITGEIQVKS